MLTTPNKQTQQNQNYRKSTIALAGIFQAAALVNDLATTGQCDEIAFDTCIQTLFKIDAPNVAAVFDGVDHLRSGIDQLLKVFDKDKKEKKRDHISQYALGVMFLQKQLSKNSDKLTEIRSRIEHVITQVEYFDGVNDTIISNLADIYITTISNLSFRLQIIGKPPHLQNSVVVNKIRALLLAGIRSSILWQQVGGKRWQLFFAKNKIFTVAKKLQAELS